MKIDELFDIEYPKTLAYSWLIPDENGINFVSAQEKDNGIVGRVKRESGIKVYPAGCITVPLKGSVLMAHLQPEDCYVAHQIGVLIPKKEMTLVEKLFYVTCIRSHAFKYNYGRQADRTLGQLEVPAIKDMMSCIDSLHTKPLTTGNVMNIGVNALEIGKWKEFSVSDLFNVVYGVNLELVNCVETTKSDSDAIAFVSRTESNNGVSAYVRPVSGVEPQPENTITVAGGGSVLATFLQTQPFYSGRDLYLLHSKETISIPAKLFLVTVIKANKYRYNYGRQANVTLPSLKLRLPSKADGKPDWQFMENYIKSLPYGDRL